MPSLIDKRIHAAIEAKQHETLLRVEGVADKATAIVTRAARDALQLIMDWSVIHRNQREAAGVLRGIFPAISALLDQQFRRLHYWSYDETVRILTKQIPRRWYRRILPQAVLVGESDGLPVPGTDIWADTFTEPVAGKRLSDADWADLLKQHLFPPPSREQVERAIYAPVAGMNWQQRLDVLSHKITDMDRLAGILATGASSGMSQSELKRQIQPVVQNIASSAARIARTEGLRIATSAQREQYAELGDMLAGVQIVATLDENTRPAHAARNGRIYWTARGKRPSITELPILPDEPNCRCYDTPVLHPPEEFENDPVLRAEFQNAAGNAIPDPQVYSQWFDRADVGRRKMAVGVKRYDAVVKRLGSSRSPRFEDFIGDDGALLSVSHLKSEIDIERERRFRRVSAAMSQRQAMLRQMSQFGFVSQKVDGGDLIPGNPGRFQKASAVRQWTGKVPYQRLLERQAKRLTDTQKEALIDYTRFSGGKLADWQEVNRKLREFVPLSSSEQAAQDAIREAIDNSLPLPKGMTTYRGIRVSSEEAEKIIGQFAKLSESGNPHLENTNTSTSISPDRATADKLAKGQSRIIYEIKPRKGIYLQQITSQKSDFEILLSDQARYTVVKIVRDVSYGAERATVIQLQEI